MVLGLPVHYLFHAHIMVDDTGLELETSCDSNFGHRLKTLKDDLYLDEVVLASQTQRINNWDNRK